MMLRRIYDSVDLQRRMRFRMAAVSVKVNPIGIVLILVLFGSVVFYLLGGIDIFKRRETISMRELLSVSIELAKRGGERVREIRNDDNLAEKVKGKTQQGKNEYVTSGDMESHRAIYYGYFKSFPGINVVSEEHEHEPADFKSIPTVSKRLAEVLDRTNSDSQVALDDVTVWMDPLDATQEYTEKLTEYVTVMTCVALRGRPVMGIIHKPFAQKGEGETIWAWEGYGHSKNLIVPEDQDKEKEGNEYKIIVSRSHAGEVESIAKKTFGEKTKVVPAGGAGFKSIEVALGNVDAYVHTTLIKKWDICAGNAILNAIKGKMTTLDGSYIDYSDGNKPKCEGGLLATISEKRHGDYVEKLKPMAEEVKEKISHPKNLRRLPELGPRSSRKRKERSG
ncbi:unnamed protein product [Owenia fusiformis]|uniref:inositol-phosphate phosphatase n=1 Tax=Owenia fusiformis TaxID=6347 RepID=A0A8J1UWN6_OWEFU|nr:unnamed protein product [Owenia fusiformis]